MKTKHTPAPWIADVEMDFVFSQGKSETNPNIICRLFDRNENNYENHQANAKLIAAAPELLDALLKLRDYVIRECTVVHKLSDVEIKFITKKADAAIQKATE